MKSAKKTPHHPKLRHHRPTGQALVELCGRRFYLGRYGKPETEERYHRLVAEWLANGRQLPVEPTDITVAEVLARFLDHAEEYYRNADGTPTGELDNYRAALRPVRKLYSSAPAVEFGPRALRAVRQAMIGAGQTRKYINANVSRIKGIFRWAVAEQILPPEVHQALACVTGLRRGRTAAKEPEPVRPVPDQHIEAVRRRVSRQVWALVRLQLLTGARGGELVRLRAIDIDTSGKVWAAELAEHKTAHHRIRRTIYFGPQAQDVLGVLMTRPVDAHLFSTREAERERHDVAPTHRRACQKPNPKKTDRAVGDHYTTASYRRAIHRACKEAGIPQWSPHRLRHNAATRLRREFGIDLAQTILGHRIGSAITEIYAEANAAKAVEVMAKVG